MYTRIFSASKEEHIMNKLINFKSIGNQKFILTLLIVFAHTYSSMDYPSASSAYNFIIVQIMRIGGGAVGTFFAISTILFFNKFTIEDYKTKLTSRFKSLIIPYFILSISTFIIHLIVSLIKKGTVKCTIDSVILDILNGEYDGPIWFLRTLFLFVLIAPALYYLVKQINLKTCIGIFLTLTTINAFIKPDYYGLLYWAPIIILFSYIGIKGLNFKVPGYVGYILGAALLTFLYFTGWGEGENAVPVYIFRMLSPIAIILMFNNLTYEPSKYQNYSMFVYLTHILLLRIPFSDNPYLHIPKTLIIFAIATIIGMIIQKISPKIYSYICGGR